MARFGYFAIFLWGAFCGAGLAAEPGGVPRPREMPSASPNQSISIDGDQGSGARAKDDSEIQQAERDVESAGNTVTPSTKTPVFLGRKPSPGGSASASHAETPWYRSSFGALGLVLGLMVLLYWGLKRWAPSFKLHDGGLIRIVSRTVLGPRQSLVMVRVGQRLLLVGVSPDRIERVCEITDADEVAALAAQSNPVDSKADFSSWLDREAAEFARTQAGEPAPQAGTRNGPAAKSLSELLRRLKAAKV